MFRPGLMILIISCISVVGSSNCEDPSSVPVCSNESITGNNYYLSGVRDSDNTMQCSCSLSTESPTSIIIKGLNPPNGCQYKFQFLYMTRSWVYSCNQTSRISINTGGSIQINLLSGTENSGGFAICLQIRSASGSNVTLSCGKSRWSTTTSSKPDIETSDTESRMSAIIGGSVGGLVVIIVVIIIVICILRKRRKDKTRESPEAAPTDAHPYQNIPDNRSGEITHPYQNILDNRSGEITHQPKQNNELVLRENDQYTSIDNDIIKPSNGNQGMEYLENDLSNNISSDYVVVDDKLKAQLPAVAENAQVNKSNANKTENGKFKTGPRGDKYAVVNKGGKMINNDQQFKIGPSGDQFAIVKKEGNKKKSKGAGKQFKIGPRGDQYAVVNKGRGGTNN